MIIRACSYQATIKTPKDPNEYEAILVTFAQEGTVIVEKEKSDLSISDGTILVQLTQEETKLFDPMKKALMQVRCYASQYDAPGSAVFVIHVYPSLNEEILP